MRQFISREFPSEDGRIGLSSDDEKYLRGVLRLNEGAVVPVRFPDESLADMTLEKDSGGWYFAPNGNPGGGFSAASGVSPNVFDFVDFALIQFLPKPNRMDDIVRQMTECGARFVVPVVGAYSPKTDAAKRMERWRKIVREARQQSASPVPTEILLPQTGESALAWWNSRRGAKMGIVLHETESGGTALTKRAAHFAAGFTATQTPADRPALPLAAIVVGTEGGIRDDERARFLDAGFFQAHFATNILRVDTAALYGMAALQTALSAALLR
jgi:16S rRNA (uracil1498-N3)-methyltransferase